MSNKTEPVQYVIKQTDLTALLEGREITIEGKSLRSDHDLMQALDIYMKPDVQIVMRELDVQGLQETILSAKQREGRNIVVLQSIGEDDTILSIIADYKSWLISWMERFVSISELPAANYLPPKVTLEEFMFVMHAIDSFRRVTYQNMLDHQVMSPAYIKVDEFLSSMANSLKSLDVRWLLPAFMAVTPGIAKHQATMSVDSIGILLQHDFFRKSKLKTGDDVLLFGEAGQMMGVEFLRSWFTSCGMEIKKGNKVIEQLFLVPTMLGTHFVSMQPNDNGKAMVNHQMDTKEQVHFKLNELFDRAFTLNQSDCTSKATINKVDSNFCGHCGFSVIAGAAFCGECGKKL